MYQQYNDMVPTSVLFTAIGDVNGDGIPDKVYLTGSKSPDSPFSQNITLVIQDGRTGRSSIQKLEQSAGYNPRIFLGDFTGNGIKDIFISIDSGGSGAFMYHYIYSFYNNQLRLLFDFNIYNNQYQYNVIYKDDYQVEVISKENNTKYIIDISMKDFNYLNEIYDPYGNRKEPITGFVNPLSGLYPVDFDSDNVYELLAYQKIAGRYNADSLGYVLNSLKWNSNYFRLFNQNVAIFGSW